MSGSKDNGHRSSSLSKTIRILRRIVESKRHWGVQELAKDLDLNVSSTHRLLQALIVEGIVSYDPQTRRYGVGAEFLRLAAIVQGDLSLEEVGRAVMQELVEACDETVCLAAYEPAGQALTPLAVEECDQPLRYTIEIGALWPLHAGASGKAVLAYLPEAEHEIGRGNLKPLTDHTITNPDRLAKELAIVRERGYAFSRGERISQAVGIAAPVFGADGRVVGCLLITIPSHRFSPGSEHRLGSLAARYASHLSKTLGCSVSDSLEMASEGEAR